MPGKAHAVDLQKKARPPIGATAPFSGRQSPGLAAHPINGAPNVPSLSSIKSSPLKKSSSTSTLKSASTQVQQPGLTSSLFIQSPALGDAALAASVIARAAPVAPPASLSVPATAKPLIASTAGSGGARPIANAAPASGTGGHWVQTTYGGRSPTIISVWVPGPASNQAKKSGMNNLGSDTEGPTPSEGESAEGLGGFGLTPGGLPQGPMTVGMTPADSLNNAMNVAATVTGVKGMVTPANTETTANMSANGPGSGDGSGDSGTSSGGVDGGGTGNASAGGPGAGD